MVSESIWKTGNNICKPRYKSILWKPYVGVIMITSLALHFIYMPHACCLICSLIFVSKWTDCSLMSQCFPKNNSSVLFWKWMVNVFIMFFPIWHNCELPISICSPKLSMNCRGLLRRALVRKVCLVRNVTVFSFVLFLFLCLKITFLKWA